MKLFYRNKGNSYISPRRQQGPKPVQIPAKSILKWICGIALVLFLFLGIGIGCFQLYHFATTAECFAIKDVSVHGLSQLSEQDILSVSGLHPGVNCFTVSIYDVERNIYTNPWVASVSVQRHLPSSFEIHVTEHKPAFWMLVDGVLNYADARGNVIAPVQPDKFTSLPILDIPAGGEPLKGAVARLLADLHNTQLALNMDMASTVRLNPGRDIEIVMRNGGLSIHIQFDNWADNLARLDILLRDLARRRELKSTKAIWVCDGLAWVTPYKK